MPMVESLVLYVCKHTKLAILLKLSAVNHSIPAWLQNTHLNPCKSRNLLKEHGQIFSTRNLSSVRVVLCMLFK